jgi:hypothetical protein
MIGKVLYYKILFIVSKPKLYFIYLNVSVTILVVIVAYVALVRVNDIFGCYEFGLIDFISLSIFSYNNISIIFIDLFKLYFEII